MSYYDDDYDDPGYVRDIGDEDNPGMDSNQQYHDPVYADSDDYTYSDEEYSKKHIRSSSLVATKSNDLPLQGKVPPLKVSPDSRPAGYCEVMSDPVPSPPLVKAIDKTMLKSISIFALKTNSLLFIVFLIAKYFSHYDLYIV